MLGRPDATDHVYWMPARPSESERAFKHNSFPSRKRAGIWCGPSLSPDESGICRIQLSLADREVDSFFRLAQFPLARATNVRRYVVDLVGKHGRVRTAPMPNWVKVAIDAWTHAASVDNGRVFRPVNCADRMEGEVLSEKVVW